MDKVEVVQWVKNEFLPLMLTTPDPVIEQQYKNAIRYFNTHSSYKKVVMVQVTGVAMQLPKEIKSVVTVLPNRTQNFLFSESPLWTLLGIQILDNVNADMILLTEAYKTYRNYIGTDFSWKFERSDDPDHGGYLFIKGNPKEASSLYVVGTQRFYEDDDIKSENVQDFVLNYTKALVKCQEGNTLRKSDIIGIKNDGQALMTEGLEMMKLLQEKLVAEGRWAAFARRF